MCEIDYLNLGLSIPALRGSQGGRDLYVALPNNSVINTFFPTHIEAVTSAQVDQVDATKAEGIANYISSKKDGYVLGAITYATDSDCEFEEALPGAQFGVLRLPLNAKLRSIDGQHRREALRSAVEVFAQVAADHTPLMLYVEPSLERRREMFADMNGSSASPSTVGNTNADDPFESASVRLSTEHPFLAGRVSSSVRKAVQGQSNYEIHEVVDALKRLFVGATGRVKSPGRYQKKDVDERGLEFFDSLAISQLSSAGSSDPGSVAQWSPVLKVLAAVAWRLRFDALGPRLDKHQWVRALNIVDFRTSGATWVTSGIAEEGKPRLGVKRPQIIAAVEALTLEMTLSKTGQVRTSHTREFAN